MNGEKKRDEALGLHFELMSMYIELYYNALNL